MSSAAQCDETSESLPTATGGTEGAAALKQLAAERLAAHRGRRAVVEGREAQDRRERAAAQAAIRLQARRDAIGADLRRDASRVREAVAARYRQSLSYREFLAAEAQRALEEAQARAEVAARSATAVAEAQRQLLREIEQWNQTETAAGADAGESFDEPPPTLEVVASRAESRIESRAELEATKSTAREETGLKFPLENFPLENFPREAFPSARLQVRLPQGIEPVSVVGVFNIPSTMTPAAAEELAELEEEIEFRRDPEFEDLVLETQPIQANIIEFPRQLVAPRKARPRLAEGPLREEGTPQPQLRIFEVGAEQISQQPAMIAAAEAPVWQGLLLGDGSAAKAGAAMSPQLEAQLQLGQQFYVASIQRRTLSVLVDGLCIGAGFAGFAAVAAKIAGQVLPGAPQVLHSAPQVLPGAPQSLLAAAAGIIVAFAVLYQLLFFTLNEATPGMRAARLAFCTFNEKSPTRKALRGRLVATALAACPLGVGLVWTVLDSDRLGWHDRMSRMYLRNY